MMPAPVRTSATHPLDVHEVPDLPGPGRLGLTLAPGKRGHGMVTGARWERDLDLDLERLRDHHRTDVLVSLLEAHEYELLEITNLLERAREVGLDVRHFPIQDVSVPRPDRPGQTWHPHRPAPLAVRLRRRRRSHLPRTTSATTSTASSWPPLPPTTTDPAPANRVT